MKLKNQAAISGFLQAKKIIVYSNPAIVELESKITLREMICSNILCCCLKIRIEIKNGGNQEIKNAVIFHALPKFIKVIPGTIRANRGHLFLNNQSKGLQLYLPSIEKNEKIIIEFTIGRLGCCCWHCNWQSFNNFTQLFTKEGKYESNKIQIYNGFFRGIRLWRR